MVGDVSYDSRPDTHAHIYEVRGLMDVAIQDLIERGHNHDRSKLEEPELSTFDEYTPKLRDTTYGSEEYERYLREMQTALRHHYDANRHHPEHFEDGIGGMNLLDLLEMLCDWMAATKRHADGDILRSIEQNQERFGYDNDVKLLLLNTVPVLDRSKGVKSP